VKEKDKDLFLEIIDEVLSKEAINELVVIYSYGHRMRRALEVVREELIEKMEEVSNEKD